MQELPELPEWLSVDDGPAPMASCEHYVSDLARAEKALARQKQSPTFDITLDLAAIDDAEVDHVIASLPTMVEEAGPRADARFGARIHTDPARAGADVAALLRHLGGRLGYVTVPDCNDPGRLELLRESVTQSARSAEVPAPPLQLVITSRLGLEQLAASVGQSGVEAAALSVLDLLASYHGAVPLSAAHSPGQFEHPMIAGAKAHFSAVCLGRSVVPSHGVTVALKDAERTESDARRAATDFAFLRQVSVHPVQIDAIVRGMTPGAETLERSRAVLRAAAEANWAPIAFDGQLEDRATYRYHVAVLKRAARRAAA